MRCIHCGADKTYVVSTRAAPGDTIRRRHICSACLQRFSSYQIACLEGCKLPENLPLPKNVVDRATRLPVLRKAPLTQRKRVCKNCELWSSHGCSLGIPEAGGLTAIGCQHFESVFYSEEDEPVTAQQA